MTGPHDFTFVSGLAFLPHCGCCGRMILHLCSICLPLVSHCLQSLVVLWPHYFLHLSISLPLSRVPCGCSGRMILHLSLTCLPLSPVPCGCLGRFFFHLSPICLPRASLSPVSRGSFGLMIFTLVSHLSPTVSRSLWVLWPHAFTLEG